MRRGLARMCALLAVGLAAPAAAGAHGHATAPFHERTHSVAFGQAPVFVPHTHPQLVVFGKDFKAGEKNQVYLERFDGVGGPQCLTCTGDPVGSDPNDVNGVPAVSPDGHWLIVHSWRGHYLTIGSPGYGGMGSALWALNLRNPAKQYQLTSLLQGSSRHGARRSG